MTILPPCSVCNLPLKNLTITGTHVTCRGAGPGPPLKFPGAKMDWIREVPTHCPQCFSAGIQLTNEGARCRICSWRVLIVESLTIMAKRGVKVT